MPKQISDVKKRLYGIAKKLLEQEGYTALSMRKVASECGIAVGTIYNYVKNKEELVALVIMEDWVRVMEKMRYAASGSSSFADGMCGIYNALEEFVRQYRDVWEQYSQLGGSSTAISSHHRMLRDQITGYIGALMERFDTLQNMSLAPLLAETVLAAAMQPDLEEEMIRMISDRIGQNSPR